MLGAETCYWNVANGVITRSRHHTSHNAALSLRALCMGPSLRPPQQVHGRALRPRHRSTPSASAGQAPDPPVQMKRKRRLGQKTSCRQGMPPLHQTATPSSPSWLCAAPRGPVSSPCRMGCGSDSLRGRSAARRGRACVCMRCCLRVCTHPAPTHHHHPGQDRVRLYCPGRLCSHQQRCGSRLSGLAPFGSTCKHRTASSPAI